MPDVPRAEAERDAMLLRRINAGDDSHGDLVGSMPRPELDERLDRLLDAGYLTFRFTGRRLRLTALGEQALARVWRRGRRYGRLIDADQLYPPAWRA